MKNILKKIFRFFFKEKDMTPTRIKILEVAISNLGKNLSSNHSYGAPQAINFIIERATGKEIENSNSTPVMHWMLLNDSNRFVETHDPLPGDIILTPTGTSPKDPDQIGNVGIIEDDRIITVNRGNGKLDHHITHEEWKNMCENFNFPIYYFRAI